MWQASPTPSALFPWGVSLDLGEVRANLRPLFLGTVLRMVLVPLVFLSLSVALRSQGQSLCGLMVLFAAPTSVASYPMAVVMGADGPLPCQLVCATPTLSVITMFCYTFLFRNFGMLCPKAKTRRDARPTKADYSRAKTPRLLPNVPDDCILQLQRSHLTETHPRNAMTYKPLREILGEKAIHRRYVEVFSTKNRADTAASLKQLKNRAAISKEAFKDFKQILIVYRRFCSFPFTLWHSLKPVFSHIPCLSVANYVVRK